MAAASYSTDLTPIFEDGGTTNWSLFSTGGGGQNAFSDSNGEVDDYIQGSNSIARNPWSSSIRGMTYADGTTYTPASGHAYFLWIKADIAQSLATKSNGGVRILIGANNAAYYVDGSDTYAFGGWKCVPIDPNVTPSSGTTGTLNEFGIAWNIPGSGPSKGFPFKIDAIRYGREFTITDGDLANGYATFAGADAVNSTISNQYGQIQLQNGVYSFQGLLKLGVTGGNSVDFRDSNKALFVYPTDFVTSTFNGIEVQNAASRVDLTSITINALGSVSKGYFEAVDNADINIDSCTFTDMSTFILQSNSTVNDSTFRRCDQVTLGGGTMSGCVFSNSTAAVALFAGSSVTTLSSLQFISSGTGHGLEINGGTNHDLSGMTFSNYAATAGDPVNGASGNEALYINVSSGTVNITADTAISYRSAGATVNITVGQKTLTISNVISGSDVVIKSSGTLTKLQDDQDITGTSTTYSYSYSAGTFIDVAVYAEGYVPYYVNNFELQPEGGTIQVAQVADRNYVP